MILFFSLLISSFIYTFFFLFALKIIMPCYYYYFQFMLKDYFCTKRVHSNPSKYYNTMDSHHPLSKCGLGLITTNETSPNVIISSSSVNPTAATKKDPGGIGFRDGTIGLMSCTESLGFESCDIETRVKDKEDDDTECKKFCGGEMERRRRKRISEDQKRLGRNNNNVIRKFPPPISSLNQNGQPCFYLKPVRKNGRLELIEVRIQRPEILRAVREDGRLRLHLVRSDIHVCSQINEEEDTKKEELHLQEEEEEEENRVEELWKYRSCNEEVISHHHHMMNEHHHSLHVWGQPCVTTR